MSDRIYRTKCETHKEKRIWKKLFFFQLPGSTINLFSKIFLPGTRHSPNSLTRIIFTWHMAQERPPKKIRRIFVPLFPKTHRRSLIFAQTETFPTAISEKGYKNKRDLIFFCAMCQVFFVRFPFSAPPPERLQKNKSVLSAWNFPMCYNAFWKYRTACAVCQVKCISIKNF